MNLSAKLAVLLIILAQFPLGSVAQSSMDLKLLENLKQNLSLTTDQQKDLEVLVVNAASEIDSLEQVKAEVQRVSDDEAFILTQIKVVNQQIKDVREMRDLEIQSKLNVEQLAIYNEKIKPTKPQVLHFGLHNRADCKVCTQ